MVLERPIVVAGAGSIGCYVGGLLAHAGRRVSLLARPRVIAEIERFGLRLTNLEDSSWHVASQQITLSDDPKILADASAVLVTVKSVDTAEIADAIARHVPQDAVIVSLQNGIANVPVLRDRLPGRTVLAAMVPFNVVAAGEGRFHRSTSGDIVIERDAADAGERAGEAEARVADAEARAAAAEADAAAARHHLAVFQQTKLVQWTAGPRRAA